MHPNWGGIRNTGSSVSARLQEPGCSIHFTSRSNERNMFKAHLALIGLSMTAAAGGTTPQLIISEVVDATLPGGLPKFVELTNTGSTTLDLSGFSIGNYSNARGTGSLR